MRFPQKIPFVAVASFLVLHIALSSQACYYASGQVALDDIPCPESNHCCPSGDTCMSNGICRDNNNFNNGANATLSDGKTFNATGLYNAGSCQTPNMEDCSLSCVNSKIPRIPPTDTPIDANNTVSISKFRSVHLVL